MSKVNLLGLDRKGLENFFSTLGEKPYRAQQLLKWIHFYGIQDFSAMTNVSQALRQKLSDVATLIAPEIAYENIASDNTCKWIVRLHDGNCVETVFIPESNRGTLCISSQVGCTLNCDFCSTGKQGFNRNLTPDEIIGQVWLAVRRLSQVNNTSENPGAHDRAITNVVMMGMGEPLLNLDNVLAAIRIMLDDDAYGLSKRRVTVSTAGVVPKMLELREASDVALAVSLHAPNDELRNRLVPLNKKYPLKELMTVCKNYFKNDGRRCIMMEYVMLAGVNDSPSHAKELIKLLNGISAKVNLIPFNPFPNTAYQSSNKETIEHFHKILMAAGITTTTRKTRGEDIDAACGQLTGRVKDRTRRQERFLKANTKKILAKTEDSLMMIDNANR